MALSREDSGQVNLDGLSKGEGINGRINEGCSQGNFS